MILTEIGQIERDSPKLGSVPFELDHLLVDFRRSTPEGCLSSAAYYSDVGVADGPNPGAIIGNGRMDGGCNVCRRTAGRAHEMRGIRNDTKHSCTARTRGAKNMAARRRRIGRALAWRDARSARRGAARPMRTRRVGAAQVQALPEHLLDDFPATSKFWATCFATFGQLRRLVGGHFFGTCGGQLLRGCRGAQAHRPLWRRRHTWGASIRRREGYARESGAEAFVKGMRRWVSFGNRGGRSGGALGSGRKERVSSESSLRSGLG